MGAILAIIAMLGFMATVILLGFVKVEIPPANRDFFLMGFGAMISFATSGVGYYIGSSKGSYEVTPCLTGSGTSCTSSAASFSALS